MIPPTRPSPRPKRQRHVRSRAALAVGLALGYQAAAFGQDAGGAPSASSEAPSASQEASEPLAPLPDVPNQDLGAPSAEQLEEVKSLLGRVVSTDPVLRERAVRELVEADPKWVPAISNALDKLADATKGEELKRKLLDIRDKARSAERERMKAAGKRGKVETPDYMEMLAQFPDPKDESWRAVTQVVALSRMLREIATTPAVRELIRVYVRYGEFLRVDIQLQLEKLDDKALPALIEARRHQAPKISHWAERQLDSLGKAIASEAVQTPDPDVLADVLRAYGYTRDPDAARVVISFANSERPQVREASRQAVALMKEVANWPLRDTYANIVGKKPPADWAWERTARELFGEFDRLRLAQVYKLFSQGTAAQKSGDLDAARAAFDKVLARSPLFSRRAEMVDTYVSFAESQLDADPKAAEAALRRARRLSTDGKVDMRVESLLWFIEGQDLVARGVADQVPFRRALEINPDNQRAREALAEIQRGEQTKKKKSDRFLAAGVIGAVALLAIAVIALRRGSPVPRLPDTPGVAPEPEDSTPEAEPSTALGSPVPRHFPVATVLETSGAAQTDPPDEPAPTGPPAANDSVTPLASNARRSDPTAQASAKHAETPAEAREAGEAAALPANTRPAAPQNPLSNTQQPDQVSQTLSPPELASTVNQATGDLRLTPALPPTKDLVLPALPGAATSGPLKLPPLEPNKDD